MHAWGGRLVSSDGQPVTVRRVNRLKLPAPHSSHRYDTPRGVVSSIPDLAADSLAFHIRNARCSAQEQRLIPHSSRSSSQVGGSSERSSSSRRGSFDIPPQQIPNSARAEVYSQLHLRCRRRRRRRRRHCCCHHVNCHCRCHRWHHHRHTHVCMHTHSTQSAHMYSMHARTPRTHAHTPRVHALHAHTPRTHYSTYAMQVLPEASVGRCQGSACPRHLDMFPAAKAAPITTDTLVCWSFHLPVAFAAASSTDATSAALSVGGS